MVAGAPGRAPLPVALRARRHRFVSCCLSIEGGRRRGCQSPVGLTDWPDLVREQTPKQSQQLLEQARKEVLDRVEEKMRREEVKDAVRGSFCVRVLGGGARD